jgi:hypothetical protein
VPPRRLHQRPTVGGAGNNGADVLGYPPDGRTVSFFDVATDRVTAMSCNGRGPRAVDRDV